MTAIAAISGSGKVWIGSDSAGVGGTLLQVRKDDKVFIKDNRFIIGCTSSFRMIQILKWSLNIKEQKTNISDEEFMMTIFIDTIRKAFKDKGFSKITDNEETGGDFLVGYKGNIFEVCSDFQVAMYDANYAAVGCGGQLCLGSMFSTAELTMDPEKRIRLALTAAEAFSSGVRGPFNVRCL